MKNRVLFFIIVSLLTTHLYCQDAIEESSNESETLPVSFSPGLIFNTSNLLLDLDEYQSGVGIKLRSELYSLRLLIHMGYESGNDVFETNLGIAYMRPLFTGRIAPYWGFALKGGYILDKDEYDDENWYTSKVLSGEVAALFGAELYILDFLSVFAEYSFGLSMNRTTVEESNNGTETETETNNYSYGTQLGNEASIGVVIYLEKRPMSSAEDNAESE